MRVSTLSYINDIRNNILVKRKNSSTWNYFVTDARDGKSSAEDVPLRRAGAKTTG